ncbi:AMP-binding protein [Lentibacillus salicampi]|nr:AMP-binding protein [Lentibacillus salicampi]
MDEDKTFTYQEFGERTDRLSLPLHEAGIEKGDHVAVMLSAEG